MDRLVWGDLASLSSPDGSLGISSQVLDPLLGQVVFVLFTVQFYYLFSFMLQEWESWQPLNNSWKGTCQSWEGFHHTRFMYPSSSTPETSTKKLDMPWRQRIIAQKVKVCHTTNMRQSLSMGSHSTSQWTPSYFLHYPNIKTEALVNFSDPRCYYVNSCSICATTKCPWSHPTEKLKLLPIPHQAYFVMCFY